MEQDERMSTRFFGRNWSSAEHTMMPQCSESSSSMGGKSARDCLAHRSSFCSWFPETEVAPREDKRRRTPARKTISIPRWNDRDEVLQGRSRGVPLSPLSVPHGRKFHSSSPEDLGAHPGGRKVGQMEIGRNAPRESGPLATRSPTNTRRSTSGLYLSKKQATSLSQHLTESSPAAVSSFTVEP